MAKEQGVIFLQKYQLDFYSGVAGAVFKFPFSADSVRDFDITNRELLNNQLAFFIQQNSIQPVSACIVISDSVLFGKDIQVVDPRKKQSDIDAFLDTVPYASVGSAVITLAPNSVRVLATNKEMYEAIRDIFTGNGFAVTSAVPGMIIKDVALTDGLTPDTARAVLGKIDSLHQYNLMQVTVLQQPLGSEKGAPAPADMPQRKSNARLFILAGVFGLLLLVLGLVVFVAK